MIDVYLLNLLQVFKDAINMALSYKKNSSDFMDVVMRELEVCVSALLFLIVLLYIAVINYLFIQHRILIWREKRIQLMKTKKREKQTDDAGVWWEPNGLFCD